ncbi:MAG: hypothetical protein ABR541_09005 [Candidatus Dormibacteria bacterium]
MPDVTPLDVHSLVADIEATVARRRAAGEYPEALLQSLRAEFRVAPREESLAALAYIDTFQPPLNRRPVLGRGIVFGKKVLRRSIAWYVQPIAQQQSRFNRAASVQMRALEERIARLEPPWQRDAGQPNSHLHTAERAAALLDALAGVAGDQVLVLEVDAAGVGAQLAEGWPEQGTAPEVARGDPLALLAGRETATLAAVVLPAVLPALSAHDLVDICATAAQRLPPGGRLLFDCPDPEGPLAWRDPSSVDPGMVRWVHRSTAQLLCEAAGFTQVAVRDVAGGWYGVTATRTG